jgi:hypothetical protein
MTAPQTIPTFFRKRCLSLVPIALLVLSMGTSVSTARASVPPSVVLI